MIFSLILFFVSCNKEDQIPVQLLINPDIESVDLSSWFSNGTNNSFSSSITNEEYFSPSHSLKISRDTLIYDPNFWYWYQLYEGKMPYGEEITLSAKIKGVNLTGGGASIAMRGDKQDSLSQFITTQHQIDIKGSFNWTEYSITLSELNNDVTKLWVFLVFTSATSGTVYFDDITLSHK